MANLYIDCFTNSKKFIFSRNFYGIRGTFTVAKWKTWFAIIYLLGSKYTLSMEYKRG